MKTTFRIASILPFWRYAVVSEQDQAHPGIPYYTLKEASRFFDETAKELPWSRFYLVKREWFWTGWLPHSELDILKRHDPDLGILSGLMSDH